MQSTQHLMLATIAMMFGGIIGLLSYQSKTVPEVLANGLLLIIGALAGVSLPFKPAPPPQTQRTIIETQLPKEDTHHG